MSLFNRSRKSNAPVCIVEGNNQLAQQLSRIVRAAAGSTPDTLCVNSVRDLGDEVRDATRLVLCSAHELEALVGVAEERFPNAWLVTWTESMAREVFALAAEHPIVVGILGESQKEPGLQASELGLAVRRLVAGDMSPARIRDFLAWDGPTIEWQPRSTDDLRSTLDDVEQRLLKFGIASRPARRILGVGHELLMNAMYDAPVDESGRATFASDRTKSITLSAEESPSFSLGTDGNSLILQVSDPFGGLRREHIYGSIQRGFRSSDRDAKREEFIDTGHGGAGLGLHRIVSGSNSTVVDVVEGVSTVVTTTFDLDQSNREFRSGAKSLLFFSRQNH